MNCSIHPGLRTTSSYLSTLHYRYSFSMDFSDLATMTRISLVRSLQFGIALETAHQFSPWWGSASTHRCITLSCWAWTRKRNYSTTRLRFGKQRSLIVSANNSKFITNTFEACLVLLNKSSASLLCTNEISEFKNSVTNVWILRGILPHRMWQFLKTMVVGNWTGIIFVCLFWLYIE